MKKEKIISLKNVSYTYPNNKRPAVDKVSFDIQKGSWTSLVGHNGSGKSTIIRLIDGLLRSNQKDAIIKIDHLLLNDQTIWSIRDQMGIVFQNPDNQFVGATVADDIAFGLENRGVSHKKMISVVHQVLKEVGMSAYAGTEPANLSGGQKQRVAIAGILAIRPKIIILDEATSMLDPEGRRQILKLMYQLKKKQHLTVLAVTHDLNEAIKADKVLILNQGRIIAQGDPKQLLQEQSLLRKSGLTMPFVFQLKKHLQTAGFKVPKTINSEEGLARYLCQFRSNM